MKAIDTNMSLIEGYMVLLKNLDPNLKLDLISKLTLSLKSTSTDNKRKFEKSFGSWDSKESADEIIKTLRNNRMFNRENELL